MCGVLKPIMETVVKQKVRIKSLQIFTVTKVCVTVGYTTFIIIQKCKTVQYLELYDM